VELTDGFVFNNSLPVQRISAIFFSDLFYHIRNGIHKQTK